MPKSKQSQPRLVAAREIRDYFQSNVKAANKVAKDANVSTNSVLGADGDASRCRGRINPAFSEAFVAAHPGTTYAEKSDAEKHLLDVPLTSPKTGRAIKGVTLPIAEVRRLAGAPAKGKVSSAALVAAGEAYQREHGQR